MASIVSTFPVQAAHLERVHESAQAALTLCDRISEGLAGNPVAGSCTALVTQPTGPIKAVFTFRPVVGQGGKEWADGLAAALADILKCPFRPDEDVSYYRYSVVVDDIRIVIERD